MAYSEYPKTRAEALEAGAKFYFTGVPCKRGHVALRRTKGNCLQCAKEDAAKAYASRADYFKEYNKRSDVREKRHEWYLKHREDVIARATGRPSELKREYHKRWKAANPDKVRAHRKSRRRKHRLATPPWLTARQKDQIRQLYRIATTMTETTGEKYVVDHIYPLRGENSCGLHVPWNLRVITDAENLAKSNKTPTGPGYTWPVRHDKNRTS